jgi:hypothetical protein
LFSCSTSLRNRVEATHDSSHQVRHACKTNAVLALLNHMPLLLYALL